jgi:hypothetical protein
MFLCILASLMLVYFAWHTVSGQAAVVPPGSPGWWQSGTLQDAEGHVLTVIFPGAGVGPAAQPVNRVGIGTTTPAAKLDVVPTKQERAAGLLMARIDGTTRTSVLEITGGSDLAEPFEIAANASVTPGMVVAIDPANPGRLRLADRAYDRTVAGIVSGANGLTPGLMMAQQERTAAGVLPVALTGRVYGWADASNGPIQPGDLLTTSYRPGHAMRVTDFTRAHGAILGKAMTALEAGQGLVLVLVTLQ